MGERERARGREIGGPCWEWAEWGAKCCDGGDLSFIHPERGGDGPGDYPIYLQPLRVKWRGGQGFIAEVRLRGGTQGTPLQRYIRTYSGGMD